MLGWTADEDPELKEWLSVTRAVASCAAGSEQELPKSWSVTVSIVLTVDPDASQPLKAPPSTIVAVVSEV